MMNKEFLQFLTANNVQIELPSYIDFSIEKSELKIILSRKSITENMQTDAAAFESWAILLKNLLMDKIEKVLITLDNSVIIPEKNLHYNRFLYRLDKFIKSFDWVYTDLRTSVCLSDLVCNFPLQEAAEAKDWKEDGEHFIECKFVEERHHDYHVLNHQLPVGLFHGEVSRDTAFTTGNLSQIDIWAENNDEFYVFELKKPGNQPAGIISELMFYVNVIDDILRHQILFIPSQSLSKSVAKNYRGFGDFYRIYQSGSIKKIHAVFLADNLHPQITQGVIDLINSSPRFKYSNIEFSWQKVN